MIEIDGSHGEGGGQVLRTALCLSMVTGEPFRIFHIRARRSRPGLQRQHLTSVRAAAEICSAELRGAALESSDLTFRPGAIVAGEYRFAIGTAGSTSLVLQTVLPALLTQTKPTALTLEGGTHNDHAPPFDFLDRAFFPALRQMGHQIEATLERPGFYPNGGGLVRVRLAPAKHPPHPWKLMERGALQGVHAQAIVSRLPREIGERETKTVARLLRAHSPSTEVVEEKRSPGPGNVVLVRVDAENVTEVFSTCGRRGVRAEDVAREVAEEAEAYLSSGAPVGPHLADQLLLPLALGGGGRFATLPPTEHTRTNAGIIQRFLDATIDIEETPEGPTIIRVAPGAAPEATTADTNTTN